MPVLKGRLKEADYTKIQINYVFLMQQLDGQFLVDEMFAADAFGESDLEEILSQDTREKRTRIFLKKLMHSGPGPAFKVFLRTLQLHYPHVAERLKESTTGNEDGLNEETSEEETLSGRQCDEKAGLYIKLPSAYSPCWLTCQRHPGHTEFIPIYSFGAHHLPPHFQSPEVVEYVRVLADQTVMTRRRYTSPSRPEGYHCSEDKGKNFNFKWWGSGRVWREMRKFSHLDNDTCPCDDCKHSSSPAKQWGQFIVVTSKTVIFDDKECEKTDFILWFDEPQVDQSFPALKGVRLISSDIVNDYSEVVCVTHDRNVSEKLAVICRKNSVLSTKLAEMCYQRKPKEKITIMISHPHRASKRVTVGEWVEGDNDRSRGPNNHVHTAAACPSSIGAPVLLLDDRMSCCTTHWGYRSNGERYSGGKLWPL